MVRQVRFDDRLMLLQAFDILGAHMFGDQWTGNEAWARPSDPPDLIRNKKNDLINQILAIDEEAAPLQKRFNLEPDLDEQSRLSGEMATLHKDRQDLERELQSLPNNLDTSVEDHAAFQRRKKIYQLIWDAAIAGELHFTAGNGMIIELRSWSEEKGFRLYPNLSMVRAPRRMSPRRSTVSIHRNEFEAWVSTHEPINRSKDTVIELSLETRAEQRLTQLFNEMDGTKDEYLDRLRKEFTDLSQQAALRIWAKCAPAHRKKAGRRRGKIE